MRLGYTILYVANVADTVAFYGRAFGMAPGLVTPDYAELETGATRLAFAASAFVRTLHPASFDDAAPDGPAPAMEIGLVTDDVHAAYDHAVAAGATPVQVPAQKPWGQWVGYVRDGNGFLVELCSPLGP